MSAADKYANSATITYQPTHEVNMSSVPDTPPRVTPSELWAEIQKARAEYSAAYAGLSEEEMTRRPGPQEDWSVKDQIAHLVWWENLAILRAALLPAAEETGTIGNLDDINAYVLAQSEHMPLAAVLAAFEANLARLEALCAGISDEVLNDKKGERRPPYWILVTDTFEHYREHLPDLQRYVASLKR